MVLSCIDQRTLAITMLKLTSSIMLLSPENLLMTFEMAFASKNLSTEYQQTRDLTTAIYQMYQNLKSYKMFNIQQKKNACNNMIHIFETCTHANLGQ